MRKNRALTDSPFHTVRGAAKVVLSGPRTIYEAITKGELRAISINDRGDLRIHDDWLTAWIERRADELAARARALRATVARGDRETSPRQGAA